MQEKAYAKINLYLHVTGKREDGYHLLDSLVVFPEVGDDLTLTSAENNQENLVKLMINGPFSGNLQHEALEDNLIIRAAHLLAAYADRPLAPVSLLLSKNLPVASGIGGGSSDAAATLRLLMAYWNIQLEETVLVELALKLGADVPVCLHPVSQQMQGIGEKLTKNIELPEFGMILVNHGEAVSTKEIFQNRQTVFSEKMTFGKKFDNFDLFINKLMLANNDLQEAACKVNPKIINVLKAIEALPFCRLARMSGSGATCFGLFETAEQAVQAAETLSAHHEWWIWGGKAIANRM